MTAPRRLPPGEPAAGQWRAVPFEELPALLGVPTTAAAPGRPTVVAVDGRSAAGKSTLARHLAATVPGSVVVHTDDLAWHEPYFAWGHLLADGVLAPLRRGEAVAFRPPQWEARDRAGAIEVPRGTPLVVVEGVGADQAAHAHLLDATVWVQSDFAEAEGRGIARDVAEGTNGDARAATAFWHDWMRAELDHLARERPWRRATLLVDGTPANPPPHGHVMVADPPA